MPKEDNAFIRLRQECQTLINNNQRRDSLYMRYAQSDRIQLQLYITRHQTLPWYQRLWQRLTQPVTYLETLNAAFTITDCKASIPAQEARNILKDEIQQLSGFSSLYASFKHAIKELIFDECIEKLQKVDDISSNVAPLFESIQELDQLISETNARWQQERAEDEQRLKNIEARLQDAKQERAAQLQQATAKLEARLQDAKQERAAQLQQATAKIEARLQDAKQERAAQLQQATAKIEARLQDAKQERAAQLQQATAKIEARLQEERQAREARLQEVMMQERQAREARLQEEKQERAQESKLLQQQIIVLSKQFEALMARLDTPQAQFALTETPTVALSTHNSALFGQARTLEPMRYQAPSLDR